MTDTNLDWKNLSFGYIRTDFNIRSYFRDGAWTKPELTSDETVTMHMAATALHYGQEAFEGQKAFRGADGKIRVFRIDENAKRLRASADYLKMAMPPVELFTDMVRQVVRANERSVALHPARIVRDRPAGRREARLRISADRFRNARRPLL